MTEGPSPAQDALRRVALLETSVAERIAAGEVIERPSSVVKELVENAVDAGATRIWVDLRDGGQSLLRVTDDGCGMVREDATLALNRFATSKIRTWEDMENLQTLGFRGEALPSIVAVSRLELLTRATGTSVGTRIVARSTDPLTVEEAGCPEGTTATVTELFFNTPARRKFLKSSASETSRIVELLGRFALLHTHIHFRLTSGEREHLNLPAQYSLQDRLKRIWGLDPRGRMADVAHAEDGVRVSGVAVCPPAFAQTRARQVLFVNGRLVVSQALSQAIQMGFEPLIPERRFAMAVVFIEVTPDAVDVNVHPTKSEIRFLSPRLVFKVVRDALAEALTRADAQPQEHVEAIRRAPGIDRLPDAPPPARPLPAQVQAAIAACQPLDTLPAEPTVFPARPVHPAPTLAAPSAPAASVPAAVRSTPAAQALELPSMPMPVPVAHVAQPSTSRWQVLAQLHRTYILALHDGDLFIVDQHTAHERINYEQLTHLSDGPREALSQPLLFPLMLELAADEAAALAGSLDIFEELGYEIEPFGGETFVVRALPSGLAALARTDVLRRVVAEVALDDRTREPQRLRELLRATTACRASVMAGDVLTREEMESLLTRLEAVPRGGYCPHGRPVSIRLGDDDLARLFHRR